MSLLAGMFGKIMKQILLNIVIIHSRTYKLCFCNWKREMCCTTYIPIQKKLEYSKSSAYEWITDKKLCTDIIQQAVWTYTSEKLVCLENLQTQNGAKKLFIMNYLHSICLTFSC